MNNYIEIIKNSFMFFPIIAFFFTVPYMIRCYHRYGTFLSLRILIVYTFILYMMTVYFLVIMPLPDIEEVIKMTGPTCQLVPFRFISDIISEASVSGDPLYLNPALLQVVYNIIMTIPFGVYSRYYFRMDFKKTLVLSFVLALFFELTQLSGLYFMYPRAYRLFDVDDLMVNTLGGVIGYILCKPLTFFLPSRDDIDRMDIRHSNKVSIFRRLIAHQIDAVILTMIDLILYLFTDIFKGEYFKLLLASGFIYLVISTLIFKGSTPGQAYVKIKTVNLNDNYSYFRVLVKYILLFLMYYELPLLIMVNASSFFKSILSDDDSFIALMIVAGIMVFYYFVEGLKMLIGKRIIIEKLSGTKIKSTIISE